MRTLFTALALLVIAIAVAISGIGKAPKISATSVISKSPKISETSGINNAPKINATSGIGKALRISETSGIDNASKINVTSGIGEAREINTTSIIDVERVLLVDGNNNLAARLRRLFNNSINNYNFNVHHVLGDPRDRGPGHTDIPRLHLGKVGAQFWTVMVRCVTQYKDAVEQTLEQFDVIWRLIDKYPQHLQFADSAQGIEDVFRAGKIASLIGVEGGHSIDSRLALVRMYYELGMRYLTLTEECDTPWARAASEKESRSKGLTKHGQKVVRELNRLGVMVDLAHASYQTRVDAIEASKAPVIFSHTNAWANCTMVGNVRDKVLKMLKKNGGIVMVSFNKAYLDCGDMSPYMEQVINNFNHLVEVAGEDHVGIGSGFEELKHAYTNNINEVSAIPRFFHQLAEIFPNETLRKIAGENLMRVFRKVEEVRDQMAQEVEVEDLIAEIPKEAKACRTDLRPGSGQRSV